jgi:hypothetical protein
MIPLERLSAARCGNDVQKTNLAANCNCVESCALEMLPKLGVNAHSSWPARNDACPKGRRSDSITWTMHEDTFKASSPLSAV